MRKYANQWIPPMWFQSLWHNDVYTFKWKIHPTFMISEIIFQENILLHNNYCRSRFHVGLPHVRQNQCVTHKFQYHIPVIKMYTEKRSRCQVNLYAEGCSLALSHRYNVIKIYVFIFYLCCCARNCNMSESWLSYPITELWRYASYLIVMDRDYLLLIMS